MTTGNNGTTDNGTNDLRRSPRVLGSLEAQLMDLLWDATAHLSGQEVCDRLDGQHNYKTVMTVLNRLVEKDLLKRELDGRAYRYRPSDDRAAFLRSVADELVRGYTQAYGDAGRTHLSAAVGSPAPSAPAAQTSAPRAPAPSEPDDKPSTLVVLVGVLIALELLRILLGRR